MGEVQTLTMSVEEFYEWQRDQEERYELIDGVPVRLRGMTGASNFHDAILINVIAHLWIALRGKPCRVVSADTAVRTAIRSTRRPDVTVDCAPAEANFYEARRPTVVVEVLSPSTRKIDQFTKLEEYRRHPTLRHILLIDPDSISAKLYSRPEGGAWSDVDLLGADATIALSAIDVDLRLGDIYERLTMTS